MKPNFFLIGAPKCGTTSLASWLSMHPQAFISNPKEPRYFNDDFDLPFRIRTLAEYEKLFLDAEGCLASGEATTGYLASNVAVDRILEYVPEARFIVCLREPINLLKSLHLHRLSQGIENCRSLERAWNLQSDRLEGKRIPGGCPDRKLLHYERFCRIGSQVSRLIEAIPRGRIHFVLLEDIASSPEQVYSDLCRFLELRQIQLQEYRNENPGQEPSSVLLAQLTRAAGMWRLRLGLRPFGIAKRVGRVNLKCVSTSELRPEFQGWIKRYFDPEVQLLQSSIQRDLSHWQ